MTIAKIAAAEAGAGPDSDLHLAGGAHMSLRLWKNETPQAKSPSRFAYETLGSFLRAAPS